MDNNTMFRLTYGLFILTASEEGKDNGCIINTAGQVTSTPNQISITVNKENLTHDMILKTRKFNLSILSETADFELFKRFGFQSGREADKFAGLAEKRKSPNEIYYITKGTNGYISAYVHQTLDLGTHTMFIAEVVGMEVLSEVPSTTYTYYQNHIKPKPETKPESGKTIWRCKVCGYEYVGEELPADFVCPICKHPVSDFEKVS